MGCPSFANILIKGEAKRIKLLGDRAILLGYNAYTSIDPSKIRGVKSNHIYFITDDIRYMFADSLEDGKFNLLFRHSW